MAKIYHLLRKSDNLLQKYYKIMVQMCHSMAQMWHTLAPSITVLLQTRKVRVWMRMSWTKCAKNSMNS